MRGKWKPHLVAKRAARLIGGKKTSKQSDGLLATWSGSNLLGDTAGQLDFAEHVIYLLEEDIRVEPILSSCAPVFGGIIIGKEIKELCWRLAANLDKLRMRIPVLPYTPTAEELEVPIEIIDARPGWKLGKNPELGTTLVCRVIDGVACPYTFEKTVNNKFLYVLANELQLTGYRAKGRFTGKRRQLVGVRFEGVLEQDKWDPTKGTFQLFAPGQFTNYNKTLLRRRAEPCPNNYNWPCHECIRGRSWSGEYPACPDPIRACRPRTLTVKYCALCGGETYHDRKRCITCQSRPPKAITEGNLVNDK